MGIIWVYLIIMITEAVTAGPHVRSEWGTMAELLRLIYILPCSSTSSLRLIMVTKDDFLYPQWIWRGKKRESFLFFLFLFNQEKKSARTISPFTCCVCYFHVGDVFYRNRRWDWSEALAMMSIWPPTDTQHAGGSSPNPWTMHHCSLARK